MLHVPINRCGRCNHDFTGPPAGTGRNGGKLCPKCAGADAEVARTYRIRRVGGGHAAYNAQAERVSRIYRTEAEVLDWVTRREAANRAQRRPCLRCNRPFDSAGPMDRLCPTCGNPHG